MTVDKENPSKEKASAATKRVKAGTGGQFSKEDFFLQKKKKFNDSREIFFVCDEWTSPF